MKKLDELLNAVLEETKEQENMRNEYISLIHGLIEGTERKGYKISKEVEGKDNTWRLNFRWFSDRMGGENISFSDSITHRNGEGMTSYDKSELDKANKEIDDAVNYMFDCGISTIDAFVEHFTKVVIPQFLQYRFPSNYEIKRNHYTATFRANRGY